MVVVRSSTKSWSWMDLDECQAQKGNIKYEKSSTCLIFPLRTPYRNDMQKKSKSEITTHSYKYSDPVDRFIICYLVFDVVAEYSVVIVHVWVQFIFQNTQFSFLLPIWGPFDEQIVSHVARFELRVQIQYIFQWQLLVNLIGFLTIPYIFLCNKEFRRKETENWQTVIKFVLSHVKPNYLLPAKKKKHAKHIRIMDGKKTEEN